MSRLLMNEVPIMILPSLAVKLGLNEAAILQQIHYWVESSQHVIGGRKWIYNTYKDWQKQFPFWSERTIRRAIRTLEDRELLISGNFNQMQIDKTKWYTINYERLGELEEIKPKQLVPLSQEEEPIETTLVNTEIQGMTSNDKAPVLEIIQYFNEKTKADYKPGTNKTQELIRARVREGFTLEDFKKVIDLKTVDWLEDPRMCKYLRPATLFGTKFESYLNQKSTKKTLSEEDFDLHD
ncbi:conserved phage C-terminal domain-containing protein [Neobacillus bataviensis]|uniref:conserved phage C-terminal domain-containing protein n=1 Tax=Neobacillus bataviensis TaxID=220685 RepID=UPI001CC18663|nr:conserved phage C-terminal domain-containing protein [Neobacillus bataviensis]